MVYKALTALNFIYLFFYVFILFLRERDRVSVGEGHRERETEDLKQAPGSELSAQNLTQVRSRSRPEPKLDA